MKRRSFIKNAATGLLGAAAFPYILPTGRLFAPTGQRIANHVVFVLFAGGIRNLESVYKAEGNLMPHLLTGNESLSSDIAGAFDPLPANTQPALQTKGTLFKELRYNQGPTGHFVGNNVDFSSHTPRPSVFEYYRKHNSPQQTALNAWWVSLHTGENELLSHSSHSQYGIQYAANYISPNYLIWNREPISHCHTFNTAAQSRVADMRNLLNTAFNNPLPEALNKTINTPEDFQKIQTFIDQTLLRRDSGALYANWQGLDLNSDMSNILMAEEIVKTFKPELMVVNMTNTDVCHDDFTGYCNNLRKADYATAHLWHTIQSTPGLANDTIMVVMPEHGRDLTHNTIVDDYGRYGIDHVGDEMSKQLFCMVLGPQDKIYQNQVINTPLGQSIDVVPTIAHILGFWQDIPAGLLPGTPLLQAFK
jgi:hypothetical protein